MNAHDEKVLFIKTYTEDGLERINTYVFLPISTTKGGLWLHSTLCGASSTALKALKEFFEEANIPANVSLAGTFILVDALKESVDEYSYSFEENIYYIH